jgi:2-amino-4-hydroxy-6-hydroxymethyldihydropteridine diphosphokinase
MSKAGRQKPTRPLEDSALRIPHSALIVVALGSNLGDSATIVRAAMDRLQAFSAAPMLHSSLWQSTPVDCPPGSPLFVNAVVGLAPMSGETPESLLAKLQTLEQEFGRGPKQSQNEPRPLDLDLIAWGNETRTAPTLVLPHSRAHGRRFVLQPLSEIAPEFVLPGQGKTVTELLGELQTDEELTRLTV